MIADFFKWLAAVLALLSFWAALVTGEIENRGVEPVATPTAQTVHWIDACGTFHTGPMPADVPLWYCPTPVPQAYP